MNPIKNPNSSKLLSMSYELLDKLEMLLDEVETFWIHLESTI